MRRLTGDYPGAARDLEEALGIYRDLGDRLGQAGALTYLGYDAAETGDYPGAARDLEEALGIYRDLGDRLGQAHALADLGDMRRLTGDYPARTGTWRKRWASPGTSATGSARPMPSTAWGTCGG